MSSPADPLPPRVLDALQRGSKIEAIKQLRSATGLSLKQAKRLIDDHLRGDPDSEVHTGQRAQTPPADRGLPTAVIAALHSGNKLEAIRLLRERTGIGLAEAKHAVESQRAPPLNAGRTPVIVTPKRGNGFWWIAVLIAAGLGAYYFAK